MGKIIKNTELVETRKNPWPAGNRASFCIWQSRGNHGAKREIPAAAYPERQAQSHEAGELLADQARVAQAVAG